MMIPKKAYDEKAQALYALRKRAELEARVQTTRCARSDEEYEW